MGGVVIAVYTPSKTLEQFICGNSNFDCCSSLAHEAELPTWSTLHIRHEQRF
ncbi:hypothetical protein Plhal703r1_c15g0073251 [Plasmopara halstedii]